MNLLSEEYSVCNRVIIILSFHLWHFSISVFLSLFLQEALLNELQSRVEKEEGRWRQQLQIKEAEFETIREENNQLQQSLEQLQRTEEVGI